MDWSREGPTWPHHERSRIVVSGGQRWHVQQWAAPREEAETVLLLHGTGASTHSWRLLAPRLAQQLHVLAVDLPGHGFSGAAPAQGASLPAMAAALRTLMRTLGCRPAWLMGHSAGAAIAVQMALNEPAGLRGIFSVNGALLPLPGLAGQVFSPLAKLLAVNPLVPWLFAWRAGSTARVRHLIDGTGSRIDEAGIELYARLVSDTAHVAGALAMMAQWDLQRLRAELPRLRVPLHLLAAEGDRTVPPSTARQVATLLPSASVQFASGLGHLAHEEDPEAVMRWLEGCL